MKKRTILALLLALAMLATLFTGCGSKEEAAAPESEAPVSEAPAPEAAPEEVPEAATYTVAPNFPEMKLGTVPLPLTEEPVTVEMWMGINPNVLAIIDDPATDCAIWAELAKRTGVTIEFTTCNPDFESEQFNLICASGDLPDILSNATTLYSGGGDAAIEDEILIDHLPYINEELTPQLVKIIATRENIIENSVTASGYLAGMPQISIQTEASTGGFGPMIRKDWLDKLGLEVPETYDEMHDVLVAFRDELGAEAPMALNYAATGINNGFVQGYGIYGLVAEAAMSEPFYQENDVIEYGPVQPEFKEYLKMVAEWYEEGLIWQDFMSFTDFQNPPTEIILSDDCGFFYGEVTFMASLAKSAKDPNFELVAIPDLVLEKGGKIPFDVDEDQEFTAGTPWSITTDCEYPELMMQWCNYFYTDDGSLLCNYGIEGESFTISENGDPVLSELVLDNPDMSSTVALFMYCMDRGPFYRDENRELSGYTQNQKDAAEIWESNITTGKGVGAYQLTAEESNECNLVYADIKTHISESVLKFITGTLDIDAEFDNYVQTIWDLGLEEVIEFHQFAYDRYLRGEQVSMGPGPGGPGGPPPDGPPPS
ncbi:MAG: extracellular solute-binding protein [Ruminococcaceae bacterium]|nr:extracellular solute-binding protein [Oscillospiraceae bacterium]